MMMDDDEDDDDDDDDDYPFLKNNLAHKGFTHCGLVTCTISPHDAPT